MLRTMIVTRDLSLLRNIPLEEMIEKDARYTYSQQKKQ